MNKLLYKKLIFPLLSILALLSMESWGTYFLVLGLPAVGAYSFYHCDTKKDYAMESALILGASMLVSTESFIMSLFWLFPLSLVLAISLKKRLSHVKILLWAIVVMSTLVILRLVLVEYLYQFDLITEMVAYWEQIDIEIPKDIASSISQLNEAQQRQFIIKYAKMTMPTWYILILSIIIMANDFIATFLLLLKKKNVLKFNVFSFYGISGEMNTALGVSLVLSYISVYLFEFGGEALLYNTMLLITILFGVYGLACVTFMGIILGLGIFYRFLLLLFCVISMGILSPFPFVIIGMLDTLFGIRKKISKRIYKIRK